MRSKRGIILCDCRNFLITCSLKTRNMQIIFLLSLFLFDALRWAGAFAQFDIGDWNGNGKANGVITKEEFSRVMDGWESCRNGICKCQFACRNLRDDIFSLDSGVDEDFDKQITWTEFLRAVESARMTEKGVMAQVR